MKKFLIIKIFESNKNNNLLNIKYEYSKYTKLKLKLNSNEISQIKTSKFGKYNGLSLLECIKKLKNKNEDIEYISQDIKWNFKGKNNAFENREEKIIVIEVKNKLKFNER